MPSLQTLRTYLLTGAYLRHLKLLIDQESALPAVLHRMLRGGTAKHAHPAEEHLSWLGIIREQELGRWGWTAPVLKEWSRQWYA